MTGRKRRAIEAPDAAGFYRAWFEAEEARRLAFRGQADEADRILADIWAEPAVKNSAQAKAGISAWKRRSG